MTTERKVEANRRNALRSTGPKSATGLAKSSKNAAKHSLYTDAVVPALGECPQQFEAFGLAVRRQLQPHGTVEGTMANRVASILWRLDRLARYETAATRAAAAAELPPDPDSITGHEVAPEPEVSSSAPPADRLAYLRNRAKPRADELEALRLTARLLDGEDGAASAVQMVWHLVAVELGLALGCEPAEALEHLREDAEMLELGGIDGLTAADLRRWLAEVADNDGHDPVAVTRSVREGLQARAAALEQTLEQSRVEEERLVAQMRLARESAAAMAFTDDGALDRVIRLESHLMKQLEASLTLLARVRGDGASRAALGGLGALVREVAARVTSIAAGEPAALPETVGSFRNGDLREVGGGGEHDGRPPAHRQ